MSADMQCLSVHCKYVISHWLINKDALVMARQDRVRQEIQAEIQEKKGEVWEMLASCRHVKNEVTSDKPCGKT